MIKSRDISESLFSDFELLESVYSYRKLNLLKKSWHTHYTEVIKTSKMQMNWG